MLEIKPRADSCKFELYRLLAKGIKSEKSGHVRPFRESISDIRKGLKK